MGTILENTTQSYSDGDQITSTNLNNLLSEATFKSTAVDQSSVTLVGGKIALPSTIPTRSFTSPTLNSPTVAGTFTVNASALGGTGIVIESEGIASNDNDTSLPTSAAVKDYVDTQLTTEDLDFAGDTGTGAVDLDSQTLTIAGTANKIETSASGQTLTLTLPSTVNISTLDAGSITVTTANIDGGSIDGTTVGASSASTGAFTTLSSTGEITAGDDIVLTNNFPVIRTDDNSEDLTLRGGLDDAGGQIKLYGSTASSANDIRYFADEHEFWNTAVTSKIAFNDNEISFGSAQDVNLYRSGADALKTDDSFEVVGDFNADSGTLFVDASADNVGIGTTSPDHKLSVFGDSSGNRTEIGIDNIDQRLVLGAYFETGVTQYSTIQATNNAESSGTNLVLQPDGGNVGIGTTSPSYKLHLAEASTDFAALIANSTSSGNGLKIAAGDNSGDRILQLLDKDGNEKMRVGATGLVGIGTTSPGQKLEVNGGNIEIDSTGGVDSRIIFSRGGTHLAWVGIPNWDEDGLYIYGPNAEGTSSDQVLVYTQDTLALKTNGSNAINVDSSQRVGIGTTSPSAKLQVAGSAIVDTNLHVKRDSDAWSTSTWINVSDFGVLNSGGSFAQTLNGNGYRNSSGQWTSFGQNSQNGATQIWQYPAGYMTFNANSSWSSGSGIIVTERMRINSDGNIGINDATPSYKLDVNGTGHFVNDLTLDEDLVHNRTGAGAFPGYSAGTFGAILEDGGSNGSTLYMSRKNSWVLYLATDTTLNAQSDKVVVFSDLNGQSGDADNIVGDITITSSSTAFNTSSDYRLKENEVDIADGIDRLKQLKPYRFNFKRDADTTVDGFFAHEVSDIVPEAITGTKDAMKDQEYEVSPAVYEDVVHSAVEATYDEDGQELTPAVEEWTESVLVTEAVRDTRSVPDYQGIDQSKLVPLLTAALQEAVAKIEALEARVHTLEG